MVCVNTGLLAVERACKLGKAWQGTWLRGIVHGQVGRIKCLQYRRAVAFQIRSRWILLRRLDSSVAGDANVAWRRRGRNKSHFPEVVCGGSVTVAATLGLHLRHCNQSIHARIRLRPRHHHWLLPKIIMTRLRSNSTFHKISDMGSATRILLE